jgi:glycine cleavage system H protein
LICDFDFRNSASPTNLKSAIGNQKSLGGTMANIPEDLHYSKDHEWVRVEGNVAVIGITDYAQNSLGDVVYVELPKAGEEFAANESFGSVESVKAVSEMFSPVSGAVVTVNDALADEPEKVNEDPYGEGWMIRVRLSNPGEVDSLLTAAEYEDFTKAETE